MSEASSERGEDIKVLDIGRFLEINDENKYVKTPMASESGMTVGSVFDNYTSAVMCAEASGK